MANHLSPAMINALRYYAVQVGASAINPATIKRRTTGAAADHGLLRRTNSGNICGLTDAGRGALAHIDGEAIKAGDVVRHTGRGMVKIGAFQRVTVTRVYELANRTRIDGQEPSGADVIGAPVDQFEIIERPAEQRDAAKQHTADRPAEHAHTLTCGCPDDTTPADRHDAMLAYRLVADAERVARRDNPAELGKVIGVVGDGPAPARVIVAWGEHAELVPHFAIAGSTHENVADLIPVDRRSGAAAEPAAPALAEVSAAEQSAVDAFNHAHPIGTPVRYWTGQREGDGKISTTRTAAQILSGHTAVVRVKGETSCIALTHVEPLPDQPDGIEDDSRDLPNPATAAERVRQYICATGDGLYDIQDGAPLYARDLEAVTRAALAQDTYKRERDEALQDVQSVTIEADAIRALVGYVEQRDGWEDDLPAYNEVTVDQLAPASVPRVTAEPTLLEMITQYGDLRASVMVESECGSPAEADEIANQAAALLERIREHLDAVPLGEVSPVTLEPIPCAATTGRLPGRTDDQSTHDALLVIASRGTVATESLPAGMVGRLVGAGMAQSVDMTGARLELTDAGGRAAGAVRARMAVATG